MIGIVDYGMGNLFSVTKGLERLGTNPIVSSNLEVLRTCDGLILPGVGAFKDAMNALQQLELIPFLHDYAETNKPLLGICLGMQLLFEQSEEHGISTGLGLIKGEIVRFSGVTEAGETYKVPHMGWNELSFTKEHQLLNGVDEDFVYFVHSYYAVPKQADTVIATASYAVDVPAIVGDANVLGMQFHPEKSGKTGIALLRNFIELVEKKVD